MTKKFTHPLMQLLVMLAIALGMLLVSMIVGGLLPIVTHADLTSRSGLLWLQGITQILTMGVPPVVAILIYQRSHTRDFIRLHFGRSHWYAALVGVVCMLLLLPLTGWLTEWNETWELGTLGEKLRAAQDTTEGLLNKLVDTTSVGGLMANLLVVALIPAVCEELFFRCGIQNWLLAWVRNRHVAVWLTAAIFSLGHGEVFAFMPRLVLGAALGYLYIYGNSALPNMLAHFINNALAVLLYWLCARGILNIDPEAPLTDSAWIIIGCTVAAVFLFIACMSKRQKISQ